MPNSLEDQIRRFEQAQDQLLETVREAHSTQKALAQDKRAMEKLLDEIKTATDQAAGDMIRAALTPEIEDGMKALKTHQTLMFGKIMDAFTDMCRTLVFGSKHDSLDNIFDTLRQRMELETQLAQERLEAGNN